MREAELRQKSMRGHPARKLAGRLIRQIRKQAGVLGVPIRPLTSLRKRLVRGLVSNIYDYAHLNRLDDLGVVFDGIDPEGKYAMRLAWSEVLCKSKELVAELNLGGWDFRFNRRR